MEHSFDYFSAKACKERFVKGCFTVGFLNGLVLGLAYTLFYIPVRKYQ